MKSIIAKYLSTSESNYKLSPSLHKKSVAPNSNAIFLRDLLSRPIERNDLGSEVGTINYVDNSNHFFIRTKALQSHTYLPEMSGESVVNINPKAFKNYGLKENDLIISKDSNIGEIIILDKDYPNYMPSGALYRLPIEKYKYYILAFIKHSFFRNQLDILVPKGATIRHAGTRFLDCKIPFPNYKSDETILYVETIMKLIVACEKRIRKNFEKIDKKITEELINSQNAKSFVFKNPSFKEIESIKRLDTGIYSMEFKRIDFLIKNYKKGYYTLNEENLKSGNTPDIRLIGTGDNLKYRWITPTNCSNLGYILIDERINMLTNNNLKSNAMLLINRTSKGGKGEYVGIANYYDISIYGEGHHNQGIYRVSGYSNEDLIFMTCFMNINLMRKYCSYICLGSKMKELRASQFLNIPFPKFSDDIKSEVISLYNNVNLISEESIIYENPQPFLEKAGIIQLEELVKKLKLNLKSALDKIISDQNIYTE